MTPPLETPSIPARRADPRVRLGVLARLARLLLVPALALGLLAAPAAAEETYDNLHDRALHLTRDAESAWKRGDPLQAGNLARQALVLLRTADRLQPRDIRVPFLAVQASVFAGDAAGARQWKDRFEERNAYGGRSPHHHYLQAFVALHVDRQPAAAIASLKRLQALDRNAMASARDALYYSALIHEGARLAGQKAYNESLLHFAEAERIARRAGNRRNELGARERFIIVLQKDDRFTQAEQLLLASIREDPENAYWFWRLGINYANRALFAQAIEPYEEAIRLHQLGKMPPEREPEVREAYLRMGNCLRTLGGSEIDPAKRKALLERAREKLAAYVRIAREDARGHYWMGILLLEDLELPHDAISWFERAYEKDPVCDHALRYLIQIHSQNDPLPTGDPAKDEEARQAWVARLAALEKEHEENKAARAAARRQREDTAGDDGCE